MQGGAPPVLKSSDIHLSVRLRVSGFQGGPSTNGKAPKTGNKLLVGGAITILKNMKVNGKDYPIYCGK